MSEASRLEKIESVNGVVRRAFRAPAADVALLWSTVLLQRFSLPFGQTALQLVTIPAVIILIREFVTGGLQVDFDRLCWFVILMLATANSLIMNFGTSALTSYGLFTVLYCMLLFRRLSTPDRFRGTLSAYQTISVFIAAIAIAQFALQFVIDGRQLIHFYGMVPDFLLPEKSGWNTTISVPSHPLLIKSNGLFLVEPSVLSQTMALAILIEVMEFRRPWYLALFAPALLVAYSGTGLMLVLAALPLTGLRAGKNALVAVLGIVILAAVLVASGVIDLSAFTDRLTEFNSPGSSGFDRFVAPFWLAQSTFAISSVKELVFGHGPGTSASFVDSFYYGGGAATAFKLWYEYGFVGAAAFACFFASCLRFSASPRLLVGAVLFTYLFLGGNLIVPSDLTRLMVLCTLTRRESPQRADHSP